MMALDEARRILAAQDTSDPGKALRALAAVLRFHGIGEPALVPIAEQLEAVAADVNRQQEQTP